MKNKDVYEISEENRSILKLIAKPIWEVVEKFEELSVDEQLSICKSIEEKGIHIWYGIPKIIETKEFFGDLALC